MDKMTHTKFNFNNFLMGLSVAFDKIFQKNKYGVSFSSQRVSYIALRLTNYTNFTAEHFCDLSAYSLLYRLDIPLTHLEQLPFINTNIITDIDVKNILELSLFIEDNIKIESNIIVNKDCITQEILKSDLYDTPLKENFSDLATDMTFWLDLVNENQLPFNIYNFLEDFTIEVEYEKLLKISKIVNAIIYAYTNNKNENSIDDTCKKMCQIYSLDNKDCSRLIITSQLHCIGKLYVAKEIYYKSNILTKEEIAIIQSIPYFSHSILASIFGFDDIAKLSSTYNERLDGTGSPYELEATHLSLKERVLAILVIYQALLEEKVYRKAFTHEEAIEILKKEALNGKLDLSIIEDLEKIF